jgi:hypothetical protein
LPLTEEEKLDIERQGWSDRRLPKGPPKGTYHNPITGQEFYGLPTDAWSIEKYAKRRTGRLSYGPAPKELKIKWATSQKEIDFSTVGPDYVPPKPVIEEMKAEESSDVINLISQLMKEVRELKSQISGNDIIEKEEEELPFNTQLNLL